MKKCAKREIMLKKEKIKYVIKDEEVEVIEKYYIDVETGERIYDRELSIDNDIRAYDEYKRKKGLLTAKEIKSIRKKYDLTQKEYALAIGVGEITVHRFENGTIQTESIDSIMRLSDEPDNMLKLLLQNRDKLEKKVFKKVMLLVTHLQNIKNHRIADINYEELKSLDFKTEDVNYVAEAVIHEYNTQAKNKENVLKIEIPRITSLELQKDLYFINGISLAIFGKPAFVNDIKAWSYGPVVEEIYYKYKDYGRSGIECCEKKAKISKGLSKIIEKVIEGYGKFTGGQLIDLTHDEEPWKITQINEVINNDIIKKYFEDVYINL